MWENCTSPLILSEAGHMPSFVNEMGVEVIGVTSGWALYKSCTIHHSLSFLPIMVFQMVGALSAWVPD